MEGGIASSNPPGPEFKSGSMSVSVSLKCEWVCDLHTCMG